MSFACSLLVECKLSESAWERKCIKCVVKLEYHYYHNKNFKKLNTKLLRTKREMYSSIRNILARLLLSICQFCQFFNSKYSGKNILVNLSILQFQLFWPEFSCQFVNSSILNILARIFLSIWLISKRRKRSRSLFT